MTIEDTLYMYIKNPENVTANNYNRFVSKRDLNKTLLIVIAQYFMQDYVYNAAHRRFIQQKPHR